jgi:hypothetical protein
MPTRDIGITDQALGRRAFREGTLSPKLQKSATDQRLFGIVD